ncbi:MAG: hypothetical protein DWQ04_32500 [Chloroflexi bacterium]|nr:MAG: hypothetical protein DWQ04_32500 [Chloroflexota bacterium]
MPHHQDDCRKLIKNYRRRLQILKENKALQGISTPPEILLEIEDIESEIEKLKEELNKINLDNEDSITITIDNQQIIIYAEGVQEQITRFLSGSVKNDMLSRKQVKQLTQEFGLLKATNTNPHLRYVEGDISYWHEQRLGIDELKLQFIARKIVLDVCERQSVIISDHGKLSWSAQQIMAMVLRIKKNRII